MTEQSYPLPGNEEAETSENKLHPSEASPLGDLLSPTRPHHRMAHSARAQEAFTDGAVGQHLIGKPSMLGPSFHKMKRLFSVRSELTSFLTELCTVWAGEIAHWVKVSAAKANSPSFIPGPTRWNERTNPYVSWQFCTCTFTHKIFKGINRG